MLPVGLVFIFIAGISFLGFVINALFDKIKITNILPLMLIGLLVGPVLGLVGTNTQSTISQLAPYVAAVAISFIIFDVGINIKLKSLGSVLGTATRFTLLVQITVGLLLAIVSHYAFGWDVAVALIFGFAVSGPSSIITPTLVQKVNIGENLKTMLVYESVLSDVMQLVVPLTLLGFLSSAALTTSLNVIGTEVFTIIVGALIFGAISAFFWLYVLNRFSDYAQGYSWMLTIAMIIATYGMSQQLGLNSTIAVFVFGVIFANVGMTSTTDESQGKNEMSGFLGKYFSIRQDVAHTIAYQKELVFFVSTFFFVYIGLIFSLGTLSYYEVALAVLLTIIILITRVVFAPTLKKHLSNDKAQRDTERALIYFNVPRGLSSIIIATLIGGYGLVVTGFTNVVFLIVLFTNVVFSIGVMYTYKPAPEPPKQTKASEKKK